MIAHPSARPRPETRDHQRVFLVCERRKSMPRVELEVCLRCRWRRNCRVLREYAQPSLFPSGQRPTGAPSRKNSGRRRG